MPNQGKVICRLNDYLKMKRMPVVMNERGICNGLVIKYLIAAAKKKKNEFFEELNFMAELHKAQYKSHETQIKLFSRDVEYAFEPEYYRTGASQSNLEMISETFHLPTQKTFSIGYAFTQESLTAAINDLSHNEDMIHLAALSHAIGLRVENGKFYLFDPNYHQDEKRFSSASELAKEIMTQFSPNKQNPVQLLPLGISIFRERKPGSIAAPQVNYPDKRELVEKLLKIDHGKVNNNQQIATTLRKACSVNDLETARLMLEKGVDPNVTDERNMSALMYAAGYSTPAMLDLIYANQRYPITQAQTEIAIFIAVRNGNVETFKHLMSRQDSSRIKEILKKNKLIYYACFTPLPSMLSAVTAYLTNSEDEQLLSKKYGSTHVEEKSCLELAAENGFSAVVSLLLSKPIVRQDIESLRTAVNVAIINGHDGVALQILEHIHTDIYNREFFELSIRHNRKWAMEKLISKVDFIPVFNQIRILLEANNHELLNVLVQNLLKRSPPQQETNQLKLLYAIVNGNIEEVATLLRKETKLLGSPLLSAGNLLRLACATGNHKALKQLLNIEIFNNELTKVGQLLITESCERGDSDMVRFLCQKFQYSPTDVSLMVIMKRAIENNNIDIVNALMFAGFDPTTIIDANKNAIELAILYRSETIILSLLTNVPKEALKSTVPKNELLEKLFIAAVRFGYKTLLNELFTKYQAAIDSDIEFNGNTYTLLELAALSEQSGTCFTLLNRRADINKGHKTKERLVLLAIKSGEYDLISYLIEKSFRIPEIIEIDNKHINVFSYAMENRQPEVIRNILKLGTLPRQVNAILLWACGNGYSGLMEDLIKSTLELTKDDIDALMKIWHESCQQNKYEILSKLHQVMTKYITLPQLSHLVNTEIIHAVQIGQIESVKELYKLIAHDKAVVSSLLDVATTVHQPAIVDFLLQEGAQYKTDAPLISLIENAYQHQLIALRESIKGKPSKFHPLLQVAYEQGHIHIFHLLLTKTNIDKEATHKLPHDFAALSTYLLEMASKKEQTAVVMRLIKSGATFAAGEKTGFDVLSRACITGDTDLVTFLLKNNVPFYKPFEMDDLNPIQIAAGFGRSNLVRLLLQSYADTLKWYPIKVLRLAIEIKDWRLVAVILEQLSNRDLKSDEIELLLPHQQNLKDTFLSIMRDSYKESETTHNQPQRNELLIRIKAVSNNLNALGMILHTATNPAFQQYSPRRDEYGFPITEHIADVRKVLNDFNVALSTTAAESRTQFRS